MWVVWVAYLKEKKRKNELRKNALNYESNLFYKYMKGPIFIKEI